MIGVLHYTSGVVCSRKLCVLFTIYQSYPSQMCYHFHNSDQRKMWVYISDTHTLSVLFKIDVHTSVALNTYNHNYTFYMLATNIVYKLYHGHTGFAWYRCTHAIALGLWPLGIMSICQANP